MDERTPRYDHSKVQYAATLPSPHSSDENFHCHDDAVLVDLKIARSAKAKRVLWISVGICLVFMVCEVVGGFWANSLAIVTDAAHLLTDFASMLISLFSLNIAVRNPSQRMSFGFHRAVPQSHHWCSAKHAASSSSGNQDYARSRSGRGTTHSAVSPAESQLTSSTAQAIRSETRQSATGNIDRVDTTSSHYASAGYYGANRNDGFSRNGSSNRGDYLSTLDRTSGRVNRNVKKTPLPEFHAKNSHIQRSNYASLLEFNQPSKKFETQPELGLNLKARRNGDDVLLLVEVVWTELTV